MCLEQLDTCTHGQNTARNITTKQLQKIVEQLSLIIFTPKWLHYKIRLQFVICTFLLQKKAQS